MADTKPLIFGVLNQQSPVLTAEKWNPILQYLTEVTSIPLQFKMGPTVKDTDAMMGRGEFDFVYSTIISRPSSMAWDTSPLRVGPAMRFTA